MEGVKFKWESDDERLDYEMMKSRLLDRYKADVERVGGMYERALTEYQTQPLYFAQERLSDAQSKLLAEKLMSDARRGRSSGVRSYKYILDLMNAEQIEDLYEEEVIVPEAMREYDLDLDSDVILERDRRREDRFDRRLHEMIRSRRVKSPIRSRRVTRRSPLSIPPDDEPYVIKPKRGRCPMM